MNKMQRSFGFITSDITCQRKGEKRKGTGNCKPASMFFVFGMFLFFSKIPIIYVYLLSRRTLRYFNLKTVNKTAFKQSFAVDIPRHEK